jgi:hypothetical protein
MFKSKFANALTTMMIGSLGIAAVENKLSVGYGAEAGHMDPLLARMCARYCQNSFIITRNVESRDVLRDPRTGFARVHPEHRFPTVSLLALGGVAMLFCFLRLADVIAALVVIRIMLQFIVQAVGVMVLRIRRPDMPRPFRMWLYPLPALLATAGFLFILFNRENWQKEVRYAAVILLTGVMIYMIRAWKDGDWPFAAASPGGN